MTYMNAAAERLLNRRRDDVLGKTWHEAFPHAVGNPVDAMYQRAMRTRQPERMEYLYPHYGRWLEISASPVRSGGVAVYFRDTSDRETLNRIGRTLASELDLERLLQAVTDAATEVSGAQFERFLLQPHQRSRRVLHAVHAFRRAARRVREIPDAAQHRGIRADFLRRRDRALRRHHARPALRQNAPHGGMPEGHLPVKSYLAVPGHGALGRGARRPVLRPRQGRRVRPTGRKDEFLAMLAHELRNPLAPIRNALHLLRMTPAPARRAPQRAT